MTRNDADRSGHDKWLIYCPRISPTTLLHLSIQGTSYAIRDFTGDCTVGAHTTKAGDPFKAHDEAGKAITVTSEFKKTYAFQWKVDVLDQGVALTKVERWREIVTRHNLRLGIGE